MPKFLIQGGHTLQGTVTVSGSKNAALPILAATILATEPVILHKVPDISDVHAFLKILSSLGAEVTFNAGTVTVNPAHLSPTQIDAHLVKHMRASILLLGPLLGRFGEVRLAYPGGCVLGKRSVHAHVHALSALGAQLIESSEEIHMKATLKPAQLIMAEASVTATENAIMAAVCTQGTSEIRWAAIEPHVQDLCHFLNSLGADIQGIGTHTLIVHGGKLLHGTEYTVTPDYLEAGTLVLATLLTNGTVTIENCPVDHLDSFWQKLEELGAQFELGQNQVKVLPHGPLKAPEKLQTSVYPGFPTDLQAPFTVLLTQCIGESAVHETLFEGRLNYLTELERMGAEVHLLNPHQARIKGPSKLKGTPIVSQDIRAGAAMVLAALLAEGETSISEINYIDRGYERLDEKLRSLGAKIERVQE
ncbi:UDP-N-acetylglucosamine 1-carboxyvinyltransferase [Candidatus Peregrinibacteria bacterium]|nr:MAG: UDP-N-acetylglucosamine 1-carboxyvinyltransferase [Candidatus Peregrinibacteria bacterium]